MRKHGLVVDNLLAVEVDTAEGGIVLASADEHPDLFWALRGGGGNFGVTLVRFGYPHPLGPTVMAGPVFWAADDTTDVLRFYRDFAAEAPDELGSVDEARHPSPLPGIPEDVPIGGRRQSPSPAATPAPSKTAACGAGPPRVRDAARRPARPRRTPLSRVASTPPFSTGGTTTWKSTNLAGLSGDAC